MKKKRLIVLSVDSLLTEDLAVLSLQQNFRFLMDNGSRINNVCSIYPSITYPAHVSMMTGCYPNKHGVCQNQVAEPGNDDPDWIVSINAVKVKTIFEAAREGGYTTACCHWPLCANGGEYIDYLIPEVWPKGPEGDMIANYEKHGASGVADIIRKNSHRLEWNKCPQLDDFITDCTCDIIKKHKPEVIFIHHSEVDSMRHKSGLFSPLVTEGLCRTDAWLGQIFGAACEAGVFDETNFVVTSDHGHLEYKRIIYLNPLFADEGLITLNNDGSIASWDAYMYSNGLSANIYLSRPDDKLLYEHVYALLKKWAADGVYGFNQVFIAEEVNRLHNLSGEFSFVIETDGYTKFGNRVTRPIIYQCDFSDYRKGYANHGHLPQKGPQPTFLCMGPDFKRGVVIEYGRIIDEAPTYAKLLGVTLPEADGSAIDAILQK